MRRAGFCLLVLVLPLQAAALFRPAVDRVLHPRWEAMGGVRLLPGSGAEAAWVHPAGLPRLGESLKLDFASGVDAAGRNAVGGGALVWPSGTDYSLAAGMDLSTRSGLGERREQSFSLAGMVALSPQLNAGVAWRAHQLESEGLQAAVAGQSLDFSLAGRAGGLHWSAAALGIAGYWPDPEWARALPLDLRAGLAWEAGDRWLLAAESGWVGTGVGGGGAVNHALGIQWSGPGRLDYRAGMAFGENGHASVGAGWDAGFFPLRLDYALAFVPDGPRHRLALQSWFSKPSWNRSWEAKLEQVLRDPSDKRLEVVQLRIDAPDAVSDTAWSLELKSPEGRSLRRWSGEGAPPTVLAWNAAGGDSELDRLAWVLKWENPQSDGSSDGTLFLGAAVPDQREEAFEEALSERKVAAPVIKPVLAAPDSGELSRVEIEMPKVDEAGVTDWQIDIQDSEGRVVKSLQGEAAMPQTLSWDGRDRQGLAISDGLGVQVVFSYRDQKGKKFTAGRPVFTQKSYERAKREALSRPRLALASLGDALMRVTLEFELSEAFLTGRRRQSLQAYPPQVSDDIGRPGVPQPFLSRPRSAQGRNYVLRLYRPGEVLIREEQRDGLDPVTHRVGERSDLVLKVTGLSAQDEDGEGSYLSRQRMLTFAEELVLEGYEGSFVLKVSDQEGRTAGVLVEVDEKN